LTLVRAPGAILLIDVELLLSTESGRFRYGTPMPRQWFTGIGRRDHHGEGAANGEALCRLLPGEYRFCPDPDCDVVYFSTDGQRFTTAEVRVPVWQKLPFGDRPICYCFGESEASMRAEIASGAGVRLIERVRAHIAAKRCACDVRNPRGACCLGDVIASVGRIEASVADAVNGAADLCRTSI
jgi:Zinc binding domain